MVTMLGVSLALIGATALAQPGAAERRFDNGATVVVIPIEGTRRVAIESFYRAGFFDEPRALCQASHLLEHLACYGATDVNAQGEWMRRLNQAGMANAETLPTFVHFDAEAPAAELEWLLKSEAARMTSLRITPELIRQETPRVYSETDSVEAQPQAPLIKHSFMAAHQVWRHGQPGALVRGGLAETPIDSFRAFHTNAYRPDRLVLVVVGDVQADAAMDFAARTIGAIPKPGPAVEPKPIDWAALPVVASAHWDSTVPCVIVAWPPPADTAERLVLSAAIGQMATTLDRDHAVARAARLVFGSNPTWPVGDLPAFLWASVKPGIEPAHAADALKHSLAAALTAGLTANDAAMIAGYLGTLRTAPDVPAQVRQMSQLLITRQNMAADKATGLATLQLALQEGIRRHVLAGIAQRDIDRAAAMTTEQINQLLRRSLASDKARTLLLLPGQAHGDR